MPCTPGFNRLIGQQTLCATRLAAAQARPSTHATIRFGPIPEGETPVEARRTTLADRNVEVRTDPTRRNPADFQFVRFRIEASVARMTLNRPEHNLLNEFMLRELIDGIAHAGE